mmetsp:Transcript_10007/g.15117  ORF Transcript_10007/g.15117 Transcript_10007/m.15117 type:complete len:1065 (+) Transcript_10007:220-3414(+)|eukprot:CAMPEP_0185021494 /NCGR_PEP_ID=MMETSP1103-20130426/4185_1 /TAXON_ID=36769 /ORGANISM="Paraphysomonas bandaiensis, Strain Caron Lab Isolate" /LENGTH=1064 /DNA_ID=CAMNT_0027553059 /DNA_START=150 /DNA_END=3344 /DNA_ORIENTATION=-
MPIHVTQTPVKKLIFPGEKVYQNKDEEAGDIQAIRMYRSLTEVDQTLFPPTIVGTDVFLIEDSIRSKLTEHRKRETTYDPSEGNIEKLPHIPQHAVRKINKEFKNLLKQSRIDVNKIQHGCSIDKELTDDDFVQWAINDAKLLDDAAKTNLYEKESDMISAEIDLCGQPLRDVKQDAEIGQSTKGRESINRAPLQHRLEELESLLKKRLVMRQRFEAVHYTHGENRPCGRVSIISRPPVVQPPKHRHSNKYHSNTRSIVPSPVSKLNLLGTKDDRSDISERLEDTKRLTFISQSSVSSKKMSADKCGTCRVTENGESKPDKHRSQSVATSLRADSLVDNGSRSTVFVSRAETDNLKAKLAAHKMRHKSTTDKEVSSTIAGSDQHLGVDIFPETSRTSSISEYDSLSSVRTLESPLKPKPPSLKMSMRQRSSPRKQISTCSTSLSGTLNTYKREKSSPESSELSESPTPVHRRSSATKLRMVASTMQQFVPEAENSTTVDFGDLKQDSEELVCHIRNMSFKRTTKKALNRTISVVPKSTAQYTSSKMSIVNKVVVHPPSEGAPVNGSGQETVNQVNHDTTQHNQRRMMGRAGKATAYDGPVNVEEAMTTVGMSESEIREKKRVDDAAKRRLGVPRTEILEENFRDNTDSLVKIIADGVEKRKKMTRIKCGFKSLQVKRSQKACLVGQKRLLVKQLNDSHRRIDMAMEDKLYRSDAKTLADRESSLSDFKHMTSSYAFPTDESIVNQNGVLDSTKELMAVALDRCSQSIYEPSYMAHVNPISSNKVAPLSPREVNMHFASIKRRMTEAHRRREIYMILKNRWFVNIVSKLRVHDQKSEHIPTCLYAFIGAIWRVFILGGSLTKVGFYTILEALVPPDTHDNKVAHSCISSIRKHLGISPPEFINYLRSKNLQPSTLLLAQERNYHKKGERKKKILAMQKVAHRGRKMSMAHVRMSVRNSIVADLVKETHSGSSSPKSLENLKNLSRKFSSSAESSAWDSSSEDGTPETSPTTVNNMAYRNAFVRAASNGVLSQKALLSKGAKFDVIEEDDDSSDPDIFDNDDETSL